MRRIEKKALTEDAIEKVSGGSILDQYRDNPDAIEFEKDKEDEEYERYTSTDGSAPNTVTPLASPYSIGDVHL